MGRGGGYVVLRSQRLTPAFLISYGKALCAFQGSNLQDQ